MSWSKTGGETKCLRAAATMAIKGNKVVCASEQCGYFEEREKGDEEK